MNEKNDNKEKIIENGVEENSELSEKQLSKIIRLLFFILFIILTFLFNV